MKQGETIKALSLIRIANSYQVATHSALFQSEINWLTKTTGTVPSEALFISYAYKGPDYDAYFDQVSAIFSSCNIKLEDILSGDPALLIQNAKFIVIGGGDIVTFMNKMDAITTPVFNPYLAIFNKIKACTPFLGWNEGSVIASPKYFAPPLSAITPAIKGIPLQIICNYENSPICDNAILNFLKNNTTIFEVVGQPMAPGGGNGGSSVRLEETGGGIIRTISDPFPIVISYKVVNGNLVKS